MKIQKYAPWLTNNYVKYELCMEVIDLKLNISLKQEIRVVIQS